jgi:hypothetical protein
MLRKNAFKIFASFAAIFMIAIPLIALADRVDYGVTGVSPQNAASIKEAGDGTIFVNAVAGATAYDLYFTLNTWAAPDKQRTRYPIGTPITARKLSGNDLSDRVALSLSEGNFAGATKTVNATYSATGSATVNNVPVYVKVAMPTCGDLKGGQQQVKIQADTAGVAGLGNGHGIIVRFTCGDAPVAPTPTPTPQICYDYYGNVIPCRNE